MATVNDALVMARSLLLDDAGVNYTDSILMSKLAQAHGELMAKLELNGVPVIREETDRTTIAAGDDLMVLPNFIVQPNIMYELPVGAPLSQAIAMEKRDTVPLLEQRETLRYWTWIGGEIRFLGATADRDVILKYVRGFPAPTEVTDNLVFKDSEIFLGPRVAALATMGKNSTIFKAAAEMAEANLSLIVRRQVKSDLPVRRRPFSATLRRRRW